MRGLSSAPLVRVLRPFGALMKLEAGAALWLRWPGSPLGCPWLCTVEQVDSGGSPSIRVAGLRMAPHRLVLPVEELVHMAAATPRKGDRLRPVNPRRVAALLRDGREVWLPYVALAEEPPVDPATMEEWVRALT